MVVDTSAVLAIIQKEPSAQRLVAALAQADMRSISTGTVLEVILLLLGRYGPDGESAIDSLRGTPRFALWRSTRSS